MISKYQAITLLVFISLSIMACRETPKGNAEFVLSESEQAEYIDKGKAIAGATFTALSTQLQAAMQKGGVPHALEYCHLNAYPLVDSLSQAHSAMIRRTTLKERNPKDIPSTEERAILEKYAKMETGGQALKPIVKQVDDQTIAFYAPIKVNAMCLQCHGKVGETLKAEDFAVIQKYYPKDRAVGYVDGDLRGMWSIQFKK